MLVTKAKDSQHLNGFCSLMKIMYGDKMKKIGLCFKAGFLFKPAILKDVFSVFSTSMFKKLRIIGYCTYPFIVSLVLMFSFSFGEYIRDYLIVNGIINNELAKEIFPFIILFIIAVPFLALVMSVLYVLAMLFFELINALINSCKKHKH